MAKKSYKPLFMPDDDWQNNACINQKVAAHDLDLFAEGYKTAAGIGSQKFRAIGFRFLTLVSG